MRLESSQFLFQGWHSRGAGVPGSAGSPSLKTKLTGSAWKHRGQYISSSTPPNPRTVWNQGGDKEGEEGTLLKEWGAEVNRGWTWASKQKRDLSEKGMEGRKEWENRHRVVGTQLCPNQELESIAMDLSSSLVTRSHYWSLHRVVFEYRNPERKQLDVIWVEIFYRISSRAVSPSGMGTCPDTWVQPRVAGEDYHNWESPQRSSQPLQTMVAAFSRTWNRTLSFQGGPLSTLASSQTQLCSRPW